MIVSRRGLLVTILGLPAAALARPPHAAPASPPTESPVSVAAGYEFRGSSVSVADVQAAVERGNHRVYAEAFAAMHRGRPPYHGPRRPS